MSSSDGPELEDLLFYQQLTTNFPDLYTTAQELCSIIVIPHNLPNSCVLARDMVESHLFRPSPCYLRKHVSLNDKYEIELDTNRTIRFFYKKDGAGEKRIKVLSQEDVRNTIRQRSYSILIIQQPLVDVSTSRSAQNGSLARPIIKSTSSTVLKFDTTLASYETSFMFLDSLNPIETKFELLRTELFLFNENYVIIPRFLESTLGKLRDIRSQFLNESYRLLKTTENREIELASEIYITGNTYTKVWPFIMQQNETEDQNLVDRIYTRQRKEQKDIDQVSLHKNQSALNELRRLDDLKSAYEKAKCIRSVLDLTIAAKTLVSVNPHKHSVSYHTRAEESVMAADETLTALIDLISQYVLTSSSRKDIHLVAHQYYIDNFRFNSLPQDVGYAFTTYAVALEYLRNDTS